MCQLTTHAPAEASEATSPKDTEATARRAAGAAVASSRGQTAPQAAMDAQTVAAWVYLAGPAGSTSTMGPARLVTAAVGLASGSAPAATSGSAPPWPAVAAWA